MIFEDDSFIREFNKSRESSVTKSPVKKQQPPRKSGFKSGRSQVVAAKLKRKENRLQITNETTGEQMNSDDRPLKGTPPKQPNPIMGRNPHDEDKLSPPLSFIQSDSRPKDKERKDLRKMFDGMEQKKKASLDLVGEKIEIATFTNKPAHNQRQQQAHTQSIPDLDSIFNSNSDIDSIEESDNDDLYEFGQPEPKRAKTFTSTERASSPPLPPINKRAQAIRGADVNVNSYAPKMPNILQDTIAGELKLNEGPARADPGQAPRDPVGLRNLGNMCYMNSVLQALFHTAFASDILSKKLGEREKETHLCLPLRAVFQALDARDKKAISADILKDSVAFYDEIFSSAAQQDAHEFLMCLLGNLYDEVQPGEKEEEEEENIVGKNFSTVLRNEIVCRACGSPVSLSDSFLSLSLDFPPKSGPALAPQTSIMALLEFFFRRSALEHKCEKCGKSSAVQAYTIRSAPKYLILHLKRWVYRGQRGFVKVRDRVAPDTTLDLKKFAETKGTDVSYALRSVVSHKGESAENGHYVTFVLDEDTRRWTLFNDSQIQAQCSPPSNEESYILVYKRMK